MLLSRREQEVLWLVKAMVPYKEIAVKLFVTEKTLKFHMTNIFKKCGVKSKRELLAKIMTEDPLPTCEPPTEIEPLAAMKIWLERHPQPYSLTMDSWRQLYGLVQKHIAQSSTAS